jgi:hypothetical protein
VHGDCWRRGIAAYDGADCRFHNGLGRVARGVSAADGRLRFDLRIRGDGGTGTGVDGRGTRWGRNRLREKAVFRLVCGAESLLQRRKWDTHF